MRPVQEQWGVLGASKAPDAAAVLSSSISNWVQVFALLLGKLTSPSRLLFVQGEYLAAMLCGLLCSLQRGPALRTLRGGVEQVASGPSHSGDEPALPLCPRPTRCGEARRARDSGGHRTGSFPFASALRPGRPVSGGPRPALPRGCCIFREKGK